MADGWIPTFWPYEDTSKGLEWIKEGAAKSGRDPSEIVVAPFTNVIPTGDAMAESMARQLISFYIGGMGEYYKAMLTGFGYGDECQRIYDLYRDKSTRSEAQAAVTPGMIEALTIAGTPQHCLDELKRRRDFGIDLPIICLPPNSSWPVIEMLLKGLAPANR